MASEGSKQRLRYFPEVYNVADENSARQIILTNDGEGADTAARWAAETPYLIELFQTTLNLRPDTLLLDYGCGIGTGSRLCRLRSLYDRFAGAVRHARRGRLAGACGDRRLGAAALLLARRRYRQDPPQPRSGR